jgi:D-alanyl-D-alanine carboxypeptidase
MRNGTVLYEHHADRRQQPASLTKMMTLYLAFEAVQNGQLKLDQRVRVSRHAARQSPTKLYLKRGQRVSIRSLIRASAIKSANDAAVALAEAVAGSEKAFARLMTAKARQFGMTNTTFRNATGFTAPGHLSTARDMAVLGRHLFFDFPQYYNLFSRKNTRAAGKRIRSHNRLLASYRGADGIKTGYTNAAGYNLVASAHRGGKRIVATLLGGRSSSWRNARMVKLLDKGFARAATRVASVPPQARRLAVTRAPVPPAKPGTPAGGLDMLVRILASQAAAATPPVRPGQDAAVFETVPETVPEIVNDAGRMPVPLPRPRWAVQLGEFENRAIAVARVTEVTLGNVEVLASAAPVIDEIRGREGTSLYRVRFIGLAPNDADRACRTLKADGRACVTLAPGT